MMIYFHTEENAGFGSDRRTTRANATEHRWQKPEGPAAGKTPFDCYGTYKARNAQQAHASRPGWARNAHTTEERPNTAYRWEHRSAANTGFWNQDTAFSENSREYGRKTRFWFSPLSSLAKIAGGALLALVGLPLLILPGPGLLAIGAGIALALSGINDVRRAFI